MENGDLVRDGISAAVARGRMPARVCFLLALLSLAACVTQNIQFEPPQNYPPAIEPSANDTPIIRLDLLVEAGDAGTSGDVVLDVSVAEAACPMNLAPTTSTTAVLAMGDALAMALLDRRGLRPEDYAALHPRGTLAWRALFRVADLMRAGDEILLYYEHGDGEELRVARSPDGIDFAEASTVLTPSAAGTLPSARINESAASTSHSIVLAARCRIFRYSRSPRVPRSGVWIASYALRNVSEGNRSSR
jgi:hypothetical protein